MSIVFLLFNNYIFYVKETETATNFSAYRNFISRILYIKNIFNS